MILDEQGDYYWHKRTGTVTRTRPETIISSPSLTLSSSSAESSFELNSLLYKSDSDNSIRVRCQSEKKSFSRTFSLLFRRSTINELNIDFQFVRSAGQMSMKKI